MSIDPRQRLLMPVLFAGLLFVALSISFHATARSAPGRTIDDPFPPSSIDAENPVTATVYLPVISNRPWPEAKFGADFGHMTAYTDVVTLDYPIVKQFGGDWIRVWLPWADVETAPGVYDWSAYDAVFQQLDNLDMRAIVVVYNAPAWAADEACGPISNDQALIDFVETLVPRYKHRTGAWEFINEPDGRGPHPYGPFIGCWGLNPQAYAQSLQIFYETVKNQDPNALVFFGGLAYDSWDYFVRDFFANTLEYGAGDYFDGLSFHFYPINPVEFPDVSYKLNELRSIMTEHGVTGKRFWITETSMWANGDNGVEGQRNFTVKELTRAYCAGADNIFWFAIRQDIVYPPTLHRWLIDADHNPVNAHDTFTNYASLVKGGVCGGQLPTLPEGVEAYQFGTERGPVIVAWTQTDGAVLSFEANSPRLLLDREGDTIEILEPTAGKITMPVESVPRFLIVQQ